MALHAESWLAAQRSSAVRHVSLLLPVPLQARVSVKRMRYVTCLRAVKDTARPDQPIPTRTNGLVQTVVALATEVLRLGQPGSAEATQSSDNTAQQRLAPGDITGLMAYLTEDFNQHAYFITGDINDLIYDDNCYFADPTVQFSGLAKWKGNLKLLVPFLIEPRIQLTKLESQQQPGNQSPTLLAQWTLQTHLKLPWRPYVDVIGATEYSLNRDANQVVRHVESWNITPIEAIKQVLLPGGRRQ